MQFNVPQLPGSGVVREIGTEFAFAAKQVLLFGTAYKALAFLQGFPSQVGNAVGALQSFRNTLGAISPSAEEAAASSQFVLDIVDKYNTPIQSARDGFTKLYASMKPTGFSGDEIRDLFLGISQAAATFGMSAEKVDRVNYAFAQMASKGQVMSEELKGQLGDVLPGAMGIFAEAAGFEGPDAITKFSKALEDGAYKGAAMKTLLTNVGVIMRKEFGPGAEGAARTFQGVINRMQNSFKLLYESFEPVAVGFLNSVVMPMTSGIKTVTDGFKAFFTGQAAQTAGGSVFAKQLEALRPAFEGIAANIKQILPLLQSFASTALSLGQTLLQIAGNPFVGYLARIYLSVLPLTMALRVLNLQVLIPLIGSFLRAIPAFIAFNAAMMSGVSTNRALIATMQLTGQAAGVTAGRIRLVSAALATLGSTAILAGIGYLVERFLMMKGAIDGVRQSTQQMLGSISGMANSGAVKELKNVGQDLQKQQTTFKELKSFVSGGTFAGGKERLTEAGAKKFEEVGMGSFVKKDVLGRPYIADFLRASEIIEEKLKGLDKQSSKVQEKLPLAAKVAADLAKQAQSAQAIASIPEAPGDGTKPPRGGKERESQIPQLTLALEKTKELSGIEMLIVNAQLMSNTAQLSSLELLKQLVEFKYEAKALGLEDLTTEERALKYKEIGLRREQAIAENQLKLQISLKKERDEIQQGFSATLAGYQQEANYQQMYLDLINQGVLPSLAKVRVEAEKAFAEGEKQLNQSIEQQEANIAGLEVTIEALKLEKNLTPEKQKQLEADEKRLEILKEDLRLRGLLKGTAPERKAAAVDAAEGGLAPKTAREYMGEGLEAAEDRLRELMNTGYQVVQAANAIGDAFGTAFKGLVSGSMTAQEALAGMFQSIADSFADMVAQMIAEYLKMQLIKGIQSLLNIFAPGGDPGGKAVGTGQGIFTAANGGIATGGFRAFANGGIVTGPTMGLVGEGRYNEAIVPLPDGKSIPVQLAEGDGGNQIISNITVNVNNGQAQSNATGSNSSEMGRKIEGAVKQVIVGELRPGGLLASKK
jgi:tape measure domain-containing protein